jgi:SecD/SecF fusion protein
MRGKGLVTFFSIALIIICIYQLSFNFVTNRIEKKATAFAEAKVLAGRPATNLSDSDLLKIRGVRQAYLDSISNQNVFNIGIAKFTYQDCKDQQLNLGLDLQGGMNVVMQVGISDLIRALADNSTDPNFLKALELTDKKVIAQPQADYVTLFGQAWNEVAPNGKLASIFATRNNQDQVKLTSTNEEVLSFIRSEATGAFDRTFNILRSRIDKFGVTQPNINAQTNAGRIVIELPGVDNPARVRKLLQASAVLEFWETYDNTAIYPYLETSNLALRNRLSVPDTTRSTDASQNAGITSSEANPLLDGGGSITDTGAVAKADTGLLGADSALTAGADQAQADQALENPLFSVLQPSVYQDQDGSYKIAPGPVVGNALGHDTAEVNRLLAMDFVRANFPRDVRFLWSAKPVNENSNVYQLYAIKMQVGTDRAPLEGDKVITARQDVDQNGKPEVSMRMNNEGAKIWKALTAKNIDQFIAIVLDDNVYSAPRVISEIPNGSSSITGGFTIDEAKDLANILQAGKLPAPAKIIAEDVVGPSLGAESIKAGVTSIFVAFVAILLFMVLYYNTSGIIADIALFFNVFFIIGVLASLGATLTLSGIAGIVLTMGMAVDANVLIHERIKEEIQAGKALARAVNEGHGKAWSAILDSNVTTFITGLVLAYFGLGPVVGYATTLNIGVVLTVVTAVFMGHLMFEFALKRNMNIKFVTPISKNNFTNRNIPFVNKRKSAYILAAAVCAVMLGAIFIKGFTYGVDFTGGRAYVVRFDKAVNTSEVRSTLGEKFGVDPIVKTYGSNNQVRITSSYLIENNSTVGDSLANVALYEGLKPYLPAGIGYDEFHSKHQLSSQVVGPSISADIRNSAIKAVIFGILGIFLYILIRFRRWQFATGTVIALFHDIIIVMGLYALFSGIMPFSLDIDETFVAVVLTVIGYSVNDKVVVFDRVREFLREHAKGDVRVVINDALNNTLNRTIMTNVTVLIVLFILFIFGGEVIRGFSFGLIIGMLICTYSSIFIAAPLVVDMSKTKEIGRTATTKASVPASAKG